MNLKHFQIKAFRLKSREKYGQSQKCLFIYERNYRDSASMFLINSKSYLFEWESNRVSDFRFKRQILCFTRQVSQDLMRMISRRLHAYAIRFHCNLRGHGSTWQRRRGYRAFARSSISENEDRSLEIRLASESPTFPAFGRRQRTFSYRTRLARVRMEIAKLVCPSIWFRSRHMSVDRVRLF